MSKIDIEVNVQEVLDQLAELMAKEDNPATIAVNLLADKATVRVLKDVLAQDPEWRRSLMQTAKDALKGVPSALAFMRDKDSWLWMRALSDYLAEGGQL